MTDSAVDTMSGGKMRAIGGALALGLAGSTFKYYADCVDEDRAQWTASHRYRTGTTKYIVGTCVVESVFVVATAPVTLPLATAKWLQETLGDRRPIAKGQWMPPTK